MYCIGSNALQGKQSWGNSQALAVVAAAFHTGGAGDTSCECIECETSSHSSGKIIISLGKLVTENYLLPVSTSKGTAGQV